MGYSPWGRKELDTTEHTRAHTHTHTHTHSMAYQLGVLQIVCPLWASGGSGWTGGGEAVRI